MLKIKNQKKKKRKEINRSKRTGDRSWSRRAESGVIGAYSEYIDFHTYIHTYRHVRLQLYVILVLL